MKTKIVLLTFMLALFNVSFASNNHDLPFVIEKNVNQLPQLSKEQARQIVEQYCQTWYDRDFTGLLYVTGSLKVKGVTRENGYYLVIGSNSYQGRSIMGTRFPHSDVQCEAKIRINEYGFQVSFHKWDEAELFKSADWRAWTEWRDVDIED